MNAPPGSPPRSEDPAVLRKSQPPSARSATSRKTQPPSARSATSRKTQPPSARSATSAEVAERAEGSSEPIRTLLIDNADSFTFNLFHLLAEVNGCEPVIVPNDWAEYSPEKLTEFDNIVISPGPGTPVEPADFGICADVIERAEIPVLGVCLGHQGIAYVHGGLVAHAPEPRHGRVSAIRHSGSGLFAGLASPFLAVRYHSLAVTEVPASLEVTAWSDDGVIMGLAHRTRPQWGVQFHPESIATECAAELLTNFARLTQEWWRSAGRGARVRDAHVASEERFLRNEEVVSEVARVPAVPRREHTLHVREVPLVTASLDVFTALFEDEPEAVWLDGNMPGHPDSRFSIMGAPAGPLSRVVTADVPAGTLEVRSARGIETIASNFFDWMNADLESIALDYADPEVDLPFAFRLGWVGYLGYELKAEVGSPLKHESDLPDARLLFLDRALVIDHETNTIYLLALSGDGATGENCESWFAQSALRLERVVPKTSAEVRTIPGPSERREAVVSSFEDYPGLTVRHSKSEYLELIGEAQRLINDGETYEVCLTNTLEIPREREALTTYVDLRRDNPTPFGAFLGSPEVSVLSTSPERFVQISAGGEAESKPIKGTRPRGNTPDEDAELMEDLRSSVKDRSENLMIVDLVRHDLGVTAELGSVEVTKLFDVETYASVHQLVSTVRSQLSADCSPVECVRAAFPPGSMTGAPKHRTMSIIDDLEGGSRGVYSGAIGFFSLNGAVDLSVLIRTAVIADDQLRYGVGGAIVALSEPVVEHEETVVKAGPLVRMLGSAQLASPVAAGS